MSNVAQVEVQDYQYGFHDEEDYFYKSGRGLSEELVRYISAMKEEPK